MPSQDATPVAVRIVQDGGLTADSVEGMLDGACFDVLGVADAVPGALVVTVRGPVLPRQLVHSLSAAAVGAWR